MDAWMATSKLRCHATHVRNALQPDMIGCAVFLCSCDAVPSRMIPFCEVSSSLTSSLNSCPRFVVFVPSIETAC